MHNKNNLSGGKRVSRYLLHIRTNLHGLLRNLLAQARRAKEVLRSSYGGSVKQAPSCGDDQGRQFLSWPDSYYFVGTEQLYRTICEAFQKQGMEYKGRYYRTASDNGQRILASLKTVSR